MCVCESRVREYTWYFKWQRYSPNMLRPTCVHHTRRCVHEVCACYQLTSLPSKQTSLGVLGGDSGAVAEIRQEVSCITPMRVLKHIYPHAMLTFRLGLGFWLDSSYFLVEFILHQKQLGLHFCDVYVAFELHKIRYNLFSVGLTHYKATSDRTLTMDKHNLYFLRRTHPQIFSQS